MSEQVSAALVLGQLGRALRQVRNDAGYTQQELARRVKVSQDTISNLERGRRWPADAKQLKQLNAVLRCCNASEEARAHIEDLLKLGRSADKHWWDEYADIFPAKELRYFAYENAAAKLLTFSGSYVPGLLQTRRYVELLAKFFRPNESKAHRDRFVDIRLKRREILDKDAVKVHFLMQEWAVMAQFGSSTDRAEQLDLLIETAARSNVSLRMIPFSAGPAATAANPFDVMEFDPAVDAPPILFSEMEKNGTLEELGKAVDAAREKFELLRACALSEEETVNRLKKALEDL